MSLVNRQLLSNTVAARWREQYGDSPDAYHHYIMLLLEKLGPEPDPSTIDGIIGNDSWTRPDPCHCCNKYYDAVVELTCTLPEEDHDRKRILVCRECLFSALELFT